MRKSIVAAAAVAAVLASSSVFAADTVTTGTIASFNKDARTLTLNDGTTYVLPATVKEPGYKAGEKVKITWRMADMKHQADSVQIVK